MPSSLLLRAGSVPVHSVLGVDVEILLESAQTRGAFSVYQATCAPGAGAPPHKHDGADEAFYIIEGTLDILNGATWHRLAPGDCVHIPRGTVHAFMFKGDGRGRLLGMCTPAGHEDFFRDAARLAAAGPLEPGPVVELCRRHAIDLVGPPVGPA